MHARTFLFVCLLSIVSLTASFSLGADLPDVEVPITVESNLAPSGPGGFSGPPILNFDERNTCDPEFFDVMSNRAWLEAQREITQNANLITKPDSVLSLSCFNQFLNTASSYADDNFPDNPQEATGDLNNIFNQLFVVLPDLSFSELDPFYPRAADAGINDIGIVGDPQRRGPGHVLFGALEVLVLDQLVNIDGGLPIGLPNGANNIGDIIDLDSGLQECVGHLGLNVKTPFLESNFLENRSFNQVPLLGARAIFADIPAPDNDIQPIDGNIPRRLNRVPGLAASYTCDLMNQVWLRSKCYNFAEESSLNQNYALGGGNLDHDGFYSLADYVALAAGNGDNRVRHSQCPAPTGGLAINFDNFDPLELVCNQERHGTLGLPSFGNLNPIDLLIGGGNATPSWQSASDDAFLDPGEAGALEAYVSHLDIMTGACSEPVQTGYIVTGVNGNQYRDAVCPVPGCVFNPPANIGGTGSCVLP